MSTQTPTPKRSFKTVVEYPDPKWKALVKYPTPVKRLTDGRVLRRRHK